MLQCEVQLWVGRLELPSQHEIARLPSGNSWGVCDEAFGVCRQVGGVATDLPPFGSQQDRHTQPNGVNEITTMVPIIGVTLVQGPRAPQDEQPSIEVH